MTFNTVHDIISYINQDQKNISITAAIPLSEKDIFSIGLAIKQTKNKKIELDLSNCTGLKELPKSCFWGECLVSLALPNCITKINQNSLCCMKLKNLVLPQCTEVIESCAFEGLTLKQLALPDSVKVIKQECFKGTMIEKRIPWCSNKYIWN